MRRLSLFPTLMSLMLSGCGLGLSEEEYVRQFRALEETYYTGTMAEADAAIRKILDLTLEAETAGLKSFEYDKIRYYAHLQISHLANAMKNDEVAKLEMDRAISSFRRIAHPDAKKSTAELIRGLTELIEEVEKVTPPAWRNASKEILQEPKH